MHPILRLLVTSGDMSGPALMFSGWIAAALVILAIGVGA